ncbi:sulfite exporter TauE/SafE family protein [Roseomonas eburnea]|uniref:Probable membrane transporter protein n=1 Tax=Neoroseomonas eburnea TaxID=1346889 RepID=A0A9X9XAE6_9PROT|nr:sulfite exporter TauE/SafE family protein [Neoroseomonas eburnea]MBR0680682.1 sulfite exporter TauE/SafE family protein [Neoroseomonas eburnea]
MWFEAMAVAASCFVAAFCAGMAGFAFVLVAAGILLHVVPPSVTAPVLVLGSLMAQSMSLPALWRHIEWPRMRFFVGMAVLGLPAGLLVLARGPAGAIVGGVGVLLVVYAGYMLARIALRMAPPEVAGSRAADGAIGFASGILGGIGGFVGALPAMWADIQGWPKDRARAFMQPFIVFMQAITTVGLAFAGFFTSEALVLTAAAVPALVLGTMLGLRAYVRLPAQGFRIILLVLLLVSGVSLLI